jgi:DnaJ homolog subfamily C member 17
LLDGFSENCEMPPANALESLRDKDLYKLLEISEDSTKEAITKAYRKKALKCHPDKNPDNPKAAEMFHLLTQTLQVLTDVAARGAYDRCRKATKATEERNSHLDAKRRKMKEDLEALVSLHCSSIS